MNEEPCICKVPVESPDWVHSDDLRWCFVCGGVIDYSGQGLTREYDDGPSDPREDER